MKKKLDLNGLLAKYEGISQTQSAPYYSPAKQYNENRYGTVQREFYQSPQVNVMNVGEEVTYTQPITGNFQMSKSECEQFLLRVRDELRN